MTTIRQIEDAIIARVQLVNTVPNLGRLLKTVDRYSGDFADENLDLMVSSAPCVLVSHTGSLVRLNTMTGSEWDGEFTLICGATSRRANSQASRVGGVAASELGSRQIAELMRDIISGQSLGQSISALVPLAIEEIYSGKAGGAGGQHFFSVTGVRFATKYSTTRSTVADEAGEQLTEIVGTLAAQIDGGATIDDPANETLTIPTGASS